MTGDTLEQVAVQYEGETLTLLPGDGWTLAEDPDYHLDDSACDTIRTALADMRAKRQLEAQPGEDYGFDAPRLVVNVTAAGERTTLTVGAENPVTGDVYVRRNGEDAVYAVDAAKFRCMEQTKAGLFGAFSPAGITVSDIEALRYTLQSGEVVSLQAVSQPTGADSTAYQTVWRLADAPDAALDTDKTDALLAALASYVTGQDTAAAPSACGFDDPLVTAEVTTADGHGCPDLRHRHRRLLHEGVGGRLGLHRGRPDRGGTLSDRRAVKIGFFRAASLPAQAPARRLSFWESFFCCSERWMDAGQSFGKHQQSD